MGNGLYCMRGAAAPMALAATLLFATEGRTQGAVPPPSGLSAWWAFDGDARDLGAGRLDGTLLGAGSFPAARVLAGYRPGALGACVTVPDAAAFDVQRSFTFEGWVRVDSLRPAHGYLVNKGGLVHRTTPYAIGIVRSSGTFPVTPGASITGVPAPGRVFAVLSDGTLEQAIISNTAVPLGSFVHVAVTVTPVVPSGHQLRIYQNGVQTGLSFLSRLPFNGTGALQLGGIAGGSSETLDGVLDEITLYDRALTASEIAAIHAAGANGKVKPQTDTTPPIVRIDQPLAGMVVGGRLVTVAATVVDESATRVASLPAGLAADLPAGGGTARADLLLEAPDGEVTIVVSATDAVGLTGAASVTVTLDTLRPVVRVLSPDLGAVLGDSPASFAVEVTDATPTRVEIGAEGRDLPAGGGAVLIPVPLVPGPNRVLVAVTDLAGNRTELAHDVLLDLDAPIVTILAPADGALFGAGSSGAAVAVRVDDSGPTTVGSQPAGVAGELPAGGGILSGVLPLQEGLNVLTLQATDRTGREAAQSITVNLDTTAPLASFASPAPNSIVRGTIEIRVQAADVAPGSGIAAVDLFVDEVRIASQPGGDVAVPLDTTQMTDGSHLLAATVADGAGNATRLLLGLTVDNTPPNVQILNPIANARVQGRMRFEAHATDVGSGMVQLQQFVGGRAPSFDGSQQLTSPRVDILATSEEETGRWPNGMLTLTAVAIDQAGNVAELDVDVQVDNQVPLAPALSPADGQRVRRRIHLLASSEQPGLQQLELAVDGVVIAASRVSPLRVPFDTRDRLDGRMQVQARVRTAHGVNTTTHWLLVDNMQLARVEPALLDLDARRAPRHAFVDVTGPNLQLLAPLLRGGIELRVAGGSPVPLANARLVRAGRCALALRLSFERDDLVAAVRAGLAGGAIDAQRRRVELTLFAGGQAIGSRTIKFTGPHRGKR
jgi:hypothetical protein